MDFETAYTAYSWQIEALAPKQYVPGLDADDVASEMLICLWKAADTYRGGDTSFGVYWWSLWLNRRSDIAAAYHAVKRVHPTPVPQVPDTAYEQAMGVVDPPKATTGAGRLIWRLLAAGETGKDVQDLTGTSRRRYYDVIRSWRTEEVRDSLRSD